MQPWEQFAAQKAPSVTAQPWEQYQPQPARPKEQGYFDRFNQPLTDIANETASIFQKDQNPASTALQFLGQGAKLAALPITETTKAAAPALAPAAQSTANAIDSTSAGQWIGDKLMQARDAINGFNQAHPELSADIGAGINVAGTLIGGGKVATPIAKPLSKNAANAITAIESASQKLPGLMGETGIKAAPAPLPGLEEVATAARNAYKASEEAGGVFNPAFTDKAISVVENAKFKPIAGDVLLPAEAAINKYLDGFSGIKGKPITLSDYQRIDSELGDAATQAWVSGKQNEGRILSDVQDKIRDLVKPEKLSNADIVGGREGIDILTKDAIPLWAAKSKMQDIQKIIERANSMDNPTTAMRTGFRNLSLSGKMKSYPMEVQKLIIKARDTGKIDDLLGIVGSRLNPIVNAATGGIGGAVMSNAASMGARGLRNYAKNRQADKIMSALVKPVEGSVKKFADDAAKAAKTQP